MSDKPTPIDSTGMTVWDAAWKCGLDLEINEQAIVFTKAEDIGLNKPDSIATISTESVAWRWLRENGYIQ